jgi:hypothetical protein
MTAEHEFGGRGKGHNGGPHLDDDDEKRIDKRLQRDKYFWRRDMEKLSCVEMNSYWQTMVRKESDPVRRAKFAKERLSPAQCYGIKLLYGRLTDYMSADLNNSPGEAWPTQKQIGIALGWSERTVRSYLRRLDVLGLAFPRCKRKGRKGARHSYILRPPMVFTPKVLH